MDLTADIPGENMPLLATPALLGSRTDLYPPPISLWRPGRRLESHHAALGCVEDILSRKEKPDGVRAGHRTRGQLRSDMNMAASSPGSACGARKWSAHDDSSRERPRRSL